VSAQLQSGKEISFICEGLFCALYMKKVRKSNNESVKLLRI